MPDAHHDAEADKGQDARDEDAAAALRCPLALATGFPCVSCPRRGHVVALGEGLVAEGVVDQAAEGDGVTEELEGRDGGLPDDDGNNDEENRLENASEGHDETRRLANLSP